MCYSVAVLDMKLSATVGCLALQTTDVATKPPLDLSLRWPGVRMVPDLPPLFDLLVDLLMSTLLDHYGYRIRSPNRC